MLELNQLIMSKCPHCLVEIHDSWKSVYITSDIEDRWEARFETCPSCNKSIIYLENIEMGMGGPIGLNSSNLVRPRGISRSPLPPEVPADIAEDYVESCLVLADSPKASAALSRRCLQNILRNAAKVKHGNLSTEIQQVLDNGALPAILADSIDAIRNIGNFAAHAMKEESGNIVQVELGEAEWNLDVLEMLFDFYYVQPAKIARKRAELDAKLAAAGKPPMK